MDTFERSAHQPPLPTSSGNGVLPGVNLDSNSELQEIYDADAVDPLTGQINLNKLR